MPREARLKEEPGGLVPQDGGWFVLNIVDARWQESPRFGRWCAFEGRDAARFPHIGVNVHVLQPGQAACLYHRENQQEDFLVLDGECLVVIAGEERRLRAWDFVHCPPDVDHVLVGAGTGPSTILMIGARLEEEELVYPANELAQKYSATAITPTTSPREAYAGSPPSVPSTPAWPRQRNHGESQ